MQDRCDNDKVSPVNSRDSSKVSTSQFRRHDKGRLFCDFISHVRHSNHRVIPLFWAPRFGGRLRIQSTFSEDDDCVTGPFSRNRATLAPTAIRLTGLPHRQTGGFRINILIAVIPGRWLSDPLHRRDPPPNADIRGRWPRLLSNHCHHRPITTNRFRLSPTDALPRLVPNRCGLTHGPATPFQRVL
jgi:hypothetical protein